MKALILAGGRGNITGALLGAINLFLIGYVLATFNFGSVQAFVTQLFYGLILIVSLLLTMLVPILGRHISFISPLRIFQSSALEAAARTRTRTSSGPGPAGSNCASRITSGPP